MAESQCAGNKTGKNPRYYRNNRGAKYFNQNQRNYNRRTYPNTNISEEAASNRSDFSDRDCFQEAANEPVCAMLESVPNNNAKHMSKEAVTSHSRQDYLNDSRECDYDNESSRTSNYRNAEHFNKQQKRFGNTHNANNFRTRQTNKSFNSSAPHETESYRHRRNYHSPHSAIRSENSNHFEESHHENQSKKTNSQRGNIVGGRYIRKQTNNSQLHPKASFSNDVPYEEISSSQRTYNPSKKTYYNFDYKRDYAFEEVCKYGGATSRKKFPINMENEETSPTDVYHYASNPVNGEKINSSSSFNKENLSSKLSRYKEDNANQRELLIHHLNRGECECLVCCEQIRVKDQTWHCLSCYHVFHLRCIRKWARSPAAVVKDGGWRCPACQNLTIKVPYDYFCFCGRQKNPDVNYHITPHSCGEICNRKKPDCTHLCKELCHPGPCPPCLIVVKKSCACGKIFKTTTCQQSTEETCSSTCDKILNCGVHSCKSLCHSGECLPCESEVSQVCFCQKDSRTVICTKESSANKHYSCGEVCEKSLNCGNHRCESLCHPGDCAKCSLSVDVILSCPCGKASLGSLVAAGKASLRKSCEDPVPVCGEICDKILFCGPKDNPHRCQSPCHTGLCPPCPLSTSSKCRCGAFTKDLKCAEISPSFVYTCEKRCNKRKDCGRHKCLNKCCVSMEHKCELVCNKKLSCGKHQCQETCHAGNCPTCWNVSFEELRCHCGETVLYPPIHCGVKPPECPHPCIRSHPCQHEVKHTCHSDDNCPPCTSLTTKWCFGHHKQCGSVMCFLEGVSCGMPCAKPLPCGNHTCQLTCHPRACLKPGEKCNQVCTTPRVSCGHPCKNVCHEGPCPDNPCKTQVTLSCPCGHRAETASCHDSTKSYHLMSVSMLATKMQEIKDGQSVNLNDMLGRKSSKNSKLQCNEECAIIERNKRLAVALQIQNPDLSCSPGPPNYSEFLKTEAKKNPSFVSDVYSKISDLVQLAKESKQKCRSHSFPPMNRDQRRVVHELAEFFGCETQSYDEEPKKNVVVTAYKNKCWLPFVSIMTVVQRDMGFRKGPAPVLAAAATNQKKKIDYFDYKE